MGYFLIEKPVKQPTLKELQMTAAILFMNKHPDLHGELKIRYDAGAQTFTACLGDVVEVFPVDLLTGLTSA